MVRDKIHDLYVNRSFVSETRVLPIRSLLQMTSYWSIHWVWFGMFDFGLLPLFNRESFDL